MSHIGNGQVKSSSSVTFSSSTIVKTVKIDLDIYAIRISPPIFIIIKMHVSNTLLFLNYYVAFKLHKT
ncbi:hypothetical protein D1839_19280 [Roseburia sp. 1XD42-34]|nr:hypothetical protein [Roseburia sp. 1XD42-34]RKI74202.1 hypothetical protein D7V87_19265 [Clostridium sp. 1xD42-85]